MKIVSYSICKNEEKNIQNFLKTIKDFDEVYVLDTGSTDNTVSILRENGIKVHQKIYDEFDFADARNSSLALVPPDTWAVYLDFNEYLHDGWREKFEQDLLNNPDANACTFKRYDDINGNLVFGNEQYYIRAHISDQYFWHHAIHESLIEKKDRKVFSSEAELSKIVQKSIEKEEFYFSIAKREYEKTKEFFYLWHVLNFYSLYRMNPYDDETFSHVESILNFYFEKKDTSFFETEIYLKLIVMYAILCLMRFEERKIDFIKCFSSFTLAYQYFKLYRDKDNSNSLKEVTCISKKHLSFLKKGVMYLSDYLTDDIFIMAEELGLN